ncbi:hypothetical protein ABKN59_006553 [Abortiporus biennis]
MLLNPSSLSTSAPPVVTHLVLETTSTRFSMALWTKSTSITMMPIHGAPSPDNAGGHFVSIPKLKPQKWLIPDVAVRRPLMTLFSLASGQQL